MRLSTFSILLCLLLSLPTACHKQDCKEPAKQAGALSKETPEKLRKALLDFLKENSENERLFQGAVTREQFAAALEGDVTEENAGDLLIGKWFFHRLDQGYTATWAFLETDAHAGKMVLEIRWIEGSYQVVKQSQAFIERNPAN